MKMFYLEKKQYDARLKKILYNKNTLKKSDFV